MGAKPTYDELEKIIQRLEREKRRRKRAEKALRQAEEMARALLNASADSTLLIDAKGIILAANENALQLMIKKNVNVCRKNLYDLLPPEIATKKRRFIDKVIRTGEPAQFDDEIHGQRLTNIIYPVFDRHGKVEKLAIYSRDLTEQQKAAAALHESEELFRSISTSAQDALIMMDGNGHITYWNESAARIFGHKKQAVIGRDLHRLLVPQRYREGFLKAADKFRRTGRGAGIGKTLELNALRKSGEEFPIELSMSSFKYHGKWHALGIVRDISDRKVAERERLQKEKLLGVLEMAGAASHELNQPLQIISGYAGLLSQSIFEDHPFFEPVNIIKAQVERMGDITKKITRITKYETLDYVDGMKIIDIHKASRKT